MLEDWDAMLQKADVSQNSCVDYNGKPDTDCQVCIKKIHMFLFILKKLFYFQTENDKK